MEHNTFEIQKHTLTGPKFIDSFENICSELKAISLRLQELLPDQSIGPEERIERIARVVSASIQKSQYHLSARSKLQIIRNRLLELTPFIEGDSMKRLEFLIQKINSTVPDSSEINLSFFEKLEKIGDFRIADNGR